MAAEPVSLYLEIEPGELPDWEIVSRASLAFASAVKEIAYILDPSIEIQLVFESGTEGSLSLNSIVRVIKGAAPDRATFKAIIWIVAAWFAADIRTYGITEALNRLFKQEQAQQLSEADIRKITEAVVQALERKIALPQVEKVYRELDRDKAIKGVGVAVEPGKRPETIVPRVQFRERGGLTDEAIKEPDANTRIKTGPARLALISPVLIPGTRKWKFSFHEGEFSARIKDTVFLEQILSGRHSIPMTAGIQMDVLLETIEKYGSGVWIVKERSVVHVTEVYPLTHQESLAFSPPPAI